MKAEPRARLAEILQQYGNEVVGEPRRLEALLRDLCPGCRLEINLLMAALREGAVEALRGASPTLPEAILLGQQTSRLETQAGLSSDAARWAVESWAAALGVVAPTAGPGAVPTGTPLEPEPGGPLSTPAVPSVPTAGPATLSASQPVGQTPANRAAADLDWEGAGQPSPTGQAITLRLTPDEAWSGVKRTLFLGQGAYHINVPPQTSDGAVLHVPDPVPPWERQGPERPLTVTIEVALDSVATRPHVGGTPIAPARTADILSVASPGPAGQTPALATEPQHGRRGFNLVISGLVGLFLFPIIGLPLMIAGGIEAGKAQPGDVDYAQSRSAVGILKWTGGLVAALFLFALVVGFLDAVS